jgi:hypothetical protein
LRCPPPTKETAAQITVEYLRWEKHTDKIDVASIEEYGNGWLVRGTCPIDTEGHQWAEKFEVFVDLKGKIRDTNYALL